jgi:hypothetical protein
MLLSNVCKFSHVLSHLLFTLIVFDMENKS